MECETGGCHNPAEFIVATGPWARRVCGSDIGDTIRYLKVVVVTVVKLED